VEYSEFAIPIKNNVMSDKKIYVTQPFLPPLSEFHEYLKKIWSNKILTNKGPFHEELEKALCNYLNVKCISLFSNGTLALFSAIKVLGIKGEVITTPFSFVATTHSLHLNNIKPVFIDIEPYNFNLDPSKIEAAITSETSAILPVHVYGNPCDVSAIQKIADKHGLKVIYDACHTFGVTTNDIPILNFGNLSVMSFHATKVFNTFEGGAVICHDEETKRNLDLLKNFGFTDETTVVKYGINAKMNEVQSAMGLLQLNYIDSNIEKRKNVTDLYRESLKGVSGLTFMEDIPDVKHCYSYFPILIDNNKYSLSRDEVYFNLQGHNIFGRRYFYPLISQFPSYKNLESSKPGKMPVAERIANEVLCLPIYADLQLSEVKRICDIIINKS
jgi:dTDP-4-amino-4,6-dideoxygalactose transaminase